MQAAVATQLSKTFPGGIRALDRADFEAKFGEVCAVIGANGSGKSTLIRALMGAVSPDEGTVRALSVEPAVASQTIAAEVGYVAQQPALDPEMTGRDTLLLYCTLYGLSRRQRRSRMDALAKEFGLTEVLPRRVSTYSGGQRQRLHLALGLVHTPRLLLLDEPTAGLDPDGRAFLWQVMRHYAEQGHAVVVVTHDLEDVLHQCHRVALLSQGTVRLAGAPADIVAEHGRVTLFITLMQTPDASLPERLAAIAGVAQVESEGRQLVLRFNGGSDPTPDVLQALQAANLTVEAYRREPPTLSSAYFHLTGQRMVRPLEGPGPGGQRGRRGGGGGGRRR